MQQLSHNQNRVILSTVLHAVNIKLICIMIGKDVMNVLVSLLNAMGTIIFHLTFINNSL